MPRICSLSSMACALALVSSARAEQGGSTHYMPGAMASFIVIW